MRKVVGPELTPEQKKEWGDFAPRGDERVSPGTEKVLKSYTRLGLGSGLTVSGRALSYGLRGYDIDQDGQVLMPIVDGKRYMTLGCGGGRRTKKAFTGDPTEGAKQ